MTQKQINAAAYAGSGTLIVLGIVLLYLWLRSYRHNIKEEVEMVNETNKEEDMEHNESYDNEVRGYRNNNPLNIRCNDRNQWKGEIRPSSDGSFCQFKTMAYGFRAAMVTLRTYITKDGCKTLQDCISRWAPFGDGNNPINYAKKVMAKFPEVFPEGKDTEINYKDRNQMAKMAYAMAIVENGSEPLMSDCYEAFDLM